jgi:hypothetical protein
MLDLRSVFTADFAELPGLRDRLSGLVARLWRDGAKAVLAATLASRQP